MACHRRCCYRNQQLRVLVCVCVCVKVTAIIISVCAILLRPSRITTNQRAATNDDVITMATASWLEPDPRRVIMGQQERKLLCTLTATVRPPPTYEQDGGGSGALEADVGNISSYRRISFGHFIFRNRMQISQRC